MPAPTAFSLIRSLPISACQRVSLSAFLALALALSVSAQDQTVTGNITVTGNASVSQLIATSGAIAGGSSGLTLAAGGTDQNITLNPSGTGNTLLNGNVGIGTNAPTALLTVGQTGAADNGSLQSFTNPSLYVTGFGPNWYTQSLVQTVTNASSGTKPFSAALVLSHQISDVTGQRNGLAIDVFDPQSNSGTIGILRGSLTNVTHQGSGSAGSLFGHVATVNNRSTGVVGNMFGGRAIVVNGNGNTAASVSSVFGYDAYIQNWGASTSIAVAKGINLSDLYNDGTITDTYGVYIGNLTAGTQTNRPFSFYASDTNALNYFGGNVGIGTTTPVAKLDVAGNAAISGNLTVGGTFTAANFASAGLTGGSTGLTLSAGGTNQNITLTPSGTGATILNGNVGIGTSAAGYRLTVSGSTGFVVTDVDNANNATVLNIHALGGKSPFIYWNENRTPRGILGYSAGNGDLVYRAGATDTASGTEVFRATSAGDVGIGTSTPAAKLDVAGNAAISGNLTVGGTFTAANFTGSGFTGGNAGLALSAGGTNQNVTITPSGTGSTIINGNATVQNSLTVSGNVTGGAAGLALMAGGTNQNVTITPSGSGSTIFNGNVGIGTSTPTSLLAVGQLGIADQGTFQYFSAPTAINNDTGGVWRTQALIRGFVNSSTAVGPGVRSALIVNQQTSVYGPITNALVATIDDPLTYTGNVSILRGGLSVASHYSSGIASSLLGQGGYINNFSASDRAIGIEGFVWNGTATGGPATPSITTAISVHGMFNNSVAASTIGTYKGLLIDDISNQGTLTNTYGVYIGNLTAGTQTNKPFSLYASDSNALNYFAGNVGIGTATPTQALDVVGNAAISGNLSVGGTFTAANFGGGAVTGGTSGLALNAGGTNQSITLTPSGTGATVINGNVGVGTASPSAKLDVAGVVRNQGVQITTLANATILGTDASGNLVAASTASFAPTSGQVTTALGYTPANKAGDTLTGTLTLATGTATAAPLRLQTGTSLTTPVFGAVEFDGTAVYVTNNASSPTRKALAYSATTLAGYGITDPVVLSSGSYADPAWIASLTAAKLTGTLAAAALPAFSGDVTSSAGSSTLTLANSGVTAGTYAKVTVDAKGRVTAGASLASVDVTGALGYTPYNSTNPSGYITAAGAPVQSVFGRTGAVTMASSDVTGALGFTPYNATNPSGYITAAGAPVQSVFGRTGAITLTAGDLTSALTFTPANKAGDTFTGNLTLAAGSATIAPLTLQSGTSLTTPVFGAVEFDGTSVYVTNNAASPTRKTLAYSATTLAGYGITDPVVLSSGSYTDPTWITSLTAAKLTGTIAAAALPAFSGDVTSSAGSSTLTLANSGVTAGTYAKVTVDAKGRVTNGTALATGDVTGALGYTPYNSTNPSSYITAAGAPVQSVFGRTGNVTLSSADVTGALGFTPFGAAGGTVGGALVVQGAVTATTMNVATSGNAVYENTPGAGNAVFFDNALVGSTIRFRTSNAAADDTTALLLSPAGGATIAGNLTVNGTSTSNIGGSLMIGGVAPGALSLVANGTTTGTNWINVANTGGTLYTGVLASNGGGLINGSNYAGAIATGGATPLQFGTNSTVRMTIDPSGSIVQTGNLTVNGTGGITVGNYAPSSGAVNVATWYIQGVNDNDALLQNWSSGGTSLGRFGVRYVAGVSSFVWKDLYNAGTSSADWMTLSQSGLTVNGTGTSSFAGPVTVAGNLTVGGTFSAAGYAASNGTVAGGATGLALNAGGTNQNVTITPSGTGATVLNGNVGIGTNSPGSLLTVGTAAVLPGSAFNGKFNFQAGALGANGGASLKIGDFSFDSGGNHAGLGVSAIRVSNGTDWTTTGVKFQFDVDNTNPVADNILTLTSAGNIGIGTANPGANLAIGDGTGSRKVAIAGAGAADNMLSIDNQAVAGIALGFNNSGAGNVYGIPSGGAYLGLAQSFPLYFSTAAVPRLTIAAAGNVGIGTSSPSTKLDVAGVVRNQGVQITTLANATLVGTDASGNLIAASATSLAPTSSQVTTALGYAPANKSGDSFTGPVSATALTASGGAVTGGSAGLTLNAGGTNQNITITPSGTGTTVLNGNVGVGTTNPGTYKLAVNGTIHTKEVVVDQTGWADDVFDSSYRNAPLSEVEQQIKEHKHLPGVPSAQDVAEKGVSVGQMQATLLRKIEELTLHQIEQEKRLNAQTARIEKLEAENTALRNSR